MLLEAVQTIGLVFQVSKCEDPFVMQRRCVEDLISELEILVQQDEGGRGIKDIALEGELLQSARALLGSHSVAIITGFPCLLDHYIPTETDGPMGALAIAKACLGLGKYVCLLTDEVNEEVMISAVAGSQLQEYLIEHDIDEDDNMGDDADLSDTISRLVVESFPPASQFNHEDETRLNELIKDCDIIVAIERPGPSQSGLYYTMRKRDMTPIISPLDRIITRDRLSIGIGDGGNEVGMGKVMDKILDSNIPNAKDIACTVSTDYLIVASVSNWGGYALAGAIVALVLQDIESSEDIINVKQTIINKLYPTVDEEIQICEKMVAAGARDGVTGNLELSVDGMPLEVSLNILCKIKTMVSQFEENCM
jgi:D-glutamate cyclase